MYESENPFGPWQQFFSLAEWEWGGADPQGAGHQPYSSGAYSPVFPAQWLSDDGKEMWMVSTACCNYTTNDPMGYVPKGHGYQFHATPVRLAVAADPQPPKSKSSKSKAR